MMSSSTLAALTADLSASYGASGRLGVRLLQREGAEQSERMRLPCLGRRHGHVHRSLIVSPCSLKDRVHAVGWHLDALADLFGDTTYLAQLGEELQ
jgi:hypothetical protein